MSFMHGGFSRSNVLVDDDESIGVVDWEMAGFFGWKQLRGSCPDPNAEEGETSLCPILQEHFQTDILFWNDLRMRGPGERYKAGSYVACIIIRERTRPYDQL
jgi:hypothetical protein